jgi:hypothetical protein
MTTLYLFHPWIEPSPAAGTTVLVFGGWWDANVTSDLGDILGRFDSPLHSAIVQGALCT